MAQWREGYLGYKMGGAKGAPQEPSVNMSLLKKYSVH